MSDKEYNGWTNYETWNVNLWLGDDDTFRELAVIEDLYDATVSLKEYTEELAEMIAPDIFKASFVSDMFGAALSQVDWYDIANHYRDELELA